jgi:FkbM family methyltransferase
MGDRAMTALDMVRATLGAVPVSVSVTGRRKKLLLSMLDPVFSRRAPGQVRTRYGTIAVDGSSGSQRVIAYAFGNLMRGYEVSELGRYIEAFDKGGEAVFVDVGANLGMYSLLAAKAGFRTIVVEPEPGHSAFLLRNAHLFTQVCPVALADMEGEAQFFVASETNLGASSMVSTAGASIYSHATMVKVTTFSSLAGQLAVDPARIRLVKIDVEGAEAAAVRGMKDFLDRGWRPEIWCEVRGMGSGRAPGSYRAVHELLSARGYRPFSTDGAISPVSDLSRFEPRAVFDLLFKA